MEFTQSVKLRERAQQVPQPEVFTVEARRAP